MIGNQELSNLIALNSKYLFRHLNNITQILDKIFVDKEPSENANFVILKVSKWPCLQTLYGIVF